jgi:Protein of unknown function (DUF1222).
MQWFDAVGYELARQVLQRGIGAMYLIAFASTLAQFRVLLGEHGLLPAPRFLARATKRTGPTLFRRRYSDRLLLVVGWAGLAISTSLVAGLPQLGQPWLPMAAFIAVWGLYLSIVDVGQTFYAFGWESLLLEAGFLAAFLGSNEVTPPFTVIVLARWLVFRLEFGAGMIKLRGDRAWRDLTAMFYHHETQPMPNPLSWFFHHLPKWFHRVEVLGNHFAQLVVPFFLFAPQPVASIAAAIVVLTQLWLVASGNFAWLNVITIVLAFSAISDPVAHAVIPTLPAHAATHPSPVWFMIVVIVFTVFMLGLSWWPLKNLFSRHQLMNASFNRWHLCNAYGAFGSVTKKRYEVIVEASMAEQPSSDDDWQPYEFKGKPGDPRRMPRQFAPYHLRLDWLMWFLALGARNDQWFLVFAMRLLEADPSTLRMIRTAPFGGERPRWVRPRMFRYRFSTWHQLRTEHVWWVRHPVAELLPPVSLPADRGEQ